MNGPRTHEWGPGEQAEYDALPWRGRDAYDHARWYVEGITHERALRVVADYGYAPAPQDD